VGGTVSQAFQGLYNLERACEIQVAAESGDAPLIPISDSIIEKTKALFEHAGAQSSGPDLLWAALLRRLDRQSPGFRE
jgi:ribulose-5-phosphate 4-epimerase/fuculose-1-phosphate aldolase